ncbi:FecR family protein [Chitinophaga eiseniae]|uniref:DUF4974 domain-containing protein n=1 Tax=Chitinophaga eiseniae TaxID=634771 RepID=A0A847STT8_9BACT|nr:FecR domain-containing protein [Chitinophaga eiseniae]NLR79862.1 DUF4974 domain-containing protein [Chitinophaga eiseniae]
MMISHDELLEIIDRIANGTASDHDLKIYNDWCNAVQPEQQAPALSPAEEKQLEMLRVIHERINPVKRGSVVKWVSIAASILLVCSLSAAWYYQRAATHHILKEAVAVHQVTNPNGAVLVLADGSKVELGAQQTGKIGQQSGADISKSSDSSLVYVFNGKSGGSSNEIQYNSLVTGKGQQFQVQLPDGTRVWVNTGSSLKFPVSFNHQSQRQVTLNGEAYFEVARDASKPFVVITNQQKVTVLGTHFNVDNYQEDTDSKTTLLEGAVRINNQLDLQPGEQATVQHSGKIDKKTVNTASVIAWKSGYFSFDGESIYDIMPKLCRWYNMEVVYANDLPVDKFEISISRSRSMADVLDFLQRTKLVKFTTNGRVITVSRY